MNTNNVLSVPAAANLTGKEYSVLKLAPGGADLAASGDSPIGTLLRGQTVREDGVYAGIAVGVQLAFGSLHFVQIGASTAAVTRGDPLAIDGSNPGQLVPSSSNPVAIAYDSFTASQGAIVRALFLSPGPGATGSAGFSGYSGISGATGATGTSGYSGYSGTSGTSGYSGYSGKSGYSGYSG